MSWTKEQPKEPGYYWWRQHDDAEKYPVRVWYESDQRVMAYCNPRTLPVRTLEVRGEWWLERIQEPPQ